MPAIYASNFGDWPMDYQDSIVHTIEAKWKSSGGKQVVMRAGTPSSRTRSKAWAIRP